jgi:hypothetical protein
MNDPLFTYSHEYSMRLECSDLDKEKCNIPLPPQSPLGIFSGQQHLPMGDWPANFLCLRHMHMSARYPNNVHLEIEMRAPFEPVPPLWRIECECGHENCGKRQTIYTSRMPDWPSISERIVRKSPKLGCDGHEFVWRKDLMRGFEFARDSPVP